MLNDRNALLAAVCGLAMGLGWGGAALGQVSGYVVSEPGAGGSGEVPEWARRLAIDPADPRLEEFRQMRRQQMEFERQIKKVRFEHLRATNRPDVRQAGFDKLRGMTDPAAFTPLVELLGDQGPDAEQFLIEHFGGIDSDKARCALAWLAVNGASESARSDARRALVDGVARTRRIPAGVVTIAEGSLGRGDGRVVLAGAELIEALGLWQLIPPLINAQFGRTSDSGDTDRTGPLAWILVGTQTAFVADLEPVVAENAVGFDPQLAVLTTGTLLVIDDAVTVTYRTEVAGVLNRLTGRFVGSDTTSIGPDPKGWARWHREVYVPWSKGPRVVESK